MPGRGTVSAAARWPTAPPAPLMPLVPAAAVPPSAVVYCSGPVQNKQALGGAKGSPEGRHNRSRTQDHDDEHGPPDGGFAWEKHAHLAPATVQTNCQAVEPAGLAQKSLENNDLRVEPERSSARGWEARSPANGNLVGFLGGLLLSRTVPPFSEAEKDQQVDSG